MPERWRPDEGTRMKTFSQLIVCEHCDSVYRRRALAPGEVARCARCAMPLYRASRLDADR